MQTPAPTVQIQPGPANAGQAITIQLPQRPMTRAELDALRATRAELSNQLNSAEGRRSRLAEELRSAGDAERPGLQARISLLDERILTIEKDIAETGRVLSSAQAQGVATTRSAGRREFGGLNPGQVTGISIVATIFVLGPLAIGAAYAMVRRSRKAPLAQPMDSPRMERIEQAVDAIAIEIERISESQRFVTRLLAERQELPAIPAGQRPAEPVGLRQGDAVRRA